MIIHKLIQQIRALTKHRVPSSQEPFAKESQRSAYPFLRRLCRELRYREATGLIGTPVRFTNVKDAPHELIPVMLPYITSPPTFHSPTLLFRQGSVAKYGLLDLEYRLAAEDLATNYRCGMSLLKELALVNHLNGDEQGDEDELADILACLEMHCEDLDKGQVFFKIFLTTPKEWEYTLQSIRTGIAPTYWPREFIIEDACITNVSSVWLARHFYL